MAVTRATFMEELAHVLPDTQSCSTDEAFLTGTLSMLMDVCDVSLDEMMAGVGLSDKIWSALSENNGETAVLLRVAKMVEKIELDEAKDNFTGLGIPLSSALECQKRAFNWQDGLTCQ